MSKVSVTITDRARRLMDDTDVPYDWDDVDLLPWYNDVVQLIMADREDARIDANGDEILYVAATDVTNDDRLLDDRWIPAEAHYVAAIAFMTDAGDRRDQDRADANMARFEALLRTL